MTTNCSFSWLPAACQCAKHSLEFSEVCLSFLLLYSTCLLLVAVLCSATGQMEVISDSLCVFFQLDVLV